MNSTGHLEFLKVYQHPFNKKRLGVEGDGGYVMGILEDNHYDCYISAGVSVEESFSRDFINLLGMAKNSCYAFDGTIEDYPWEYTRNIQFVRKNISNLSSENSTILLEYIHKYNNVFLKMDIEGGEYPWLSLMYPEALSRIKQMVIELHGINDDSWGYSFDIKKACLEKLAGTHYLIHAHGNNYGGVRADGLPNVIELTYVRKDVYVEELQLNKTVLPIDGLDFPNYEGLPDLHLATYPFVMGVKE